MIKTVLTTTCAFALMTGVAFAQAKTDGGTTRGPGSPTSGNSGTSLSTGQTQPLAPGAYSTQSSVGLNATSGSVSGGPGATPNGPATSGGSAMPASTAMPATVMAPAPTLIANTPEGAAPEKYPRCTHKGQDRCMSMAHR